MRYPLVKIALPLLIALGAGCTTTGTGFGSAASGAAPMTFNWKSRCGRDGGRACAAAAGMTGTRAQSS